eukprot:1875644-Alexandrium_andersonii.AAC.1
MHPRALQQTLLTPSDSPINPCHHSAFAHLQRHNAQHALSTPSPPIPPTTGTPDLRPRCPLSARLSAQFNRGPAE